MRRYETSPAGLIALCPYFKLEKFKLEKGPFSQSYERSVTEVCKALHCTSVRLTLLKSSKIELKQIVCWTPCRKHPVFLLDSITQPGIFCFGFVFVNLSDSCFTAPGVNGVSVCLWNTQPFTRRFLSLRFSHPLRKCVPTARDIP